MDLGPSELRSVTSAHSGNTSVIVWQTSFSIYMQLLDINGDKVGNASVVGAVSANSNGYPIVSAPEITVLSNSNYAISWRQGSTGTATNIAMLSSAGSTIGSTQTLNIGGTDGNADKETNIVGIANSKYAVVGSSGGVVKLALMDGRINKPIGNSIKTLSLSGTTANDSPSITTIGTEGKFVVVWRGIESGEWHTYMQHFDENGESSSAVDKFIATGGHGPAKVVGVDTAGDYVIVWAAIGDSQRYEVRVQKYNSDGEKVGKQLAFTGQDTSDNSLNFDITPVGNKGAFSITFDGKDSAANGSDRSIYVVQVDEYGSVIQP
nr:hypothetical protein [Enterovibrio nigricans]